MDTDEKQIAVPPPPPDYDAVKKQLEIDKINKEIAGLDIELKRKWYKKPQWIAALSPIFLGVLTVIIAFATGLLQNQSTLNKIQEESFNQRKQAINDSIIQLRHLSDSLSKYVTNLSYERKLLDSTVNVLKSFQDTLFYQLTTKDERLAFTNRRFVTSKNEADSLKRVLKIMEREKEIAEYKSYLRDREKEIADLEKEIEYLDKLMLGNNKKRKRIDSLNMSPKN
ncbi:MAG: hypothetical protein NTW29_01690 [Bacteroidetes bacterium]|nr:hypothetical protein [Bacteroidota bacterium]